MLTPPEVDGYTEVDGYASLDESSASSASDSKLDSSMELGRGPLYSISLSTGFRAYIRSAERSSIQGL